MLDRFAKGCVDVIARAINRQAASPSGLFGQLLGLIWRREHGILNIEVLDQLDVRRGQQVLEIGCGPGYALQEAARRASGGRVVGVDISALMTSLALKRNRQAVARGEVDIRVGDIESLSLDGATFDRIFSVHCIYFWRDVDAVLAKLALGLRPAGKLILSFRPEGDDIPARFRDPIYRFPRLDALEAALDRVGLAIDRVAPSAIAPSVVLLTASSKE